MVISLGNSDTVSIELVQDAELLNLVTSGAELEFLPLTDFPMYRLAPEVINKLKPIYDLSKINGAIITRQPHFNRLIQMLVTVGLINYYGSIEYPGNPKYQAKLNRVDFEKHKQAMLKTAYKHDKLNNNLQYYNQQLKLCNFFQNIKSTWDYIKLKQKKNQVLQVYDTSKDYNYNQIEQTVLAIFNGLEALNLVEACYYKAYYRLSNSSRLYTFSFF